jgi:copper resistance protein B
MRAAVLALALAHGGLCLLVASAATAAAEFAADQFEWQTGSDTDALKWDVRARIGGDTNRLWLLDEGLRAAGDPVENRVEVLWGHVLPSQWEVVAGARHDDGATPSRTYAALGLLKSRPESFRVEVTGYVGDYGHLGLRLKADYDRPIAGRLGLTARAEGEVWNDDHDRARVGSGPIQAAAGLRLRYRIRPAVAPYVGYEWERLFDDTANQARRAGKDPGRSVWVAGLSFRF